MIIAYAIIAQQSTPSLTYSPYIITRYIIIFSKMSSYIIAGSADSIDTAYCEEIARRISSRYRNIDFRIVIKHPSQWQLYLQEICRIYGFLKKSNPIIYTFDGKIIGGRDNFVQTATKYFGLDEELLIAEHISSKTNMKLAQQELKLKKTIRSGTKTLQELVQGKYRDLLMRKVLRHSLKQRQTHLVNGIQYILRQLDTVPTMKFTKHAQIPISKEQIIPQQINLMALSLNDMVKPEQALAKQAFVTANNEKQKHPPSEQDRMSEASKTNKMHESIISYDKDSKGVKDSNRTKLRIDEENDDVPDYVDYPFADTAITELSDQFWVAFDPKSVIGEQIIFYHNQDPAGNTLRLHNDGRPIKGHRVLIKEIHYENQNFIQQELMTKNEISEGEGEPEGELEGEALVEQEQKIQKPKTQPNIPAIQSQKHLGGINTNKHVQEDAISEPHSDLNLISHLNYHTLFIHKPLSILELKNLHYFIRETDTIAALQFLPENPNPRVKLYLRDHLLPKEDNKVMPTERFIQKQIEQGEFQEFNVPSEKGVILTEEIQNFRVRVIHGMGFTHYVLDAAADEERLHKAIKYTIDHMLAIEEQVRHDIGYNFIFTKKRIILVPLVQPYAVYNGSKLYLDGLAFLGVIHTAKLERPYEISKPKVGNEDKGAEIRQMLAKTTAFQEEE